jgi:hypothetical protein
MRFLRQYLPEKEAQAAVEADSQNKWACKRSQSRR